MTVASDIERLARSLSGLDPAERRDRLQALVERLPLGERFELLHRLGVYHHAESLSGAASTLAETAALRAALPGLLAEHEVHTLLDIPCGDFHWMQQVPLGAEYLGADVVPAIVEANRRRFESPAPGGRRFVVLDATRDPLPAVDLILCRDLLIHLSLADIRAALRNFAASGSRLLLATHFADRLANTDIVSGDFHPVNLCCAPFALPPPLAVIEEGSRLGDGEFGDRALALWRLADVGQALRRDLTLPEGPP